MRGKKSRAVRAQGDASEGGKQWAKLTKPARDRITATELAFLKQRKQPLENASLSYSALLRASVESVTLTQV
jgi:hypothetical protein